MINDNNFVKELMKKLWVSETCIFASAVSNANPLLNKN